MVINVFRLTNYKAITRLLVITVEESVELCDCFDVHQRDSLETSNNVIFTLGTHRDDLPLYFSPTTLKSRR